jgi:tetratricopeptide (TPR) repeat protein
MDGRQWRRVFCSLALAASVVGCKNSRNQTQPTMPAPLQPQTQQSSGFLGLGSRQPKFPGPPQEHVAVRPATKKGQGVKLETEIAWADTQVEAAIAEGRTTVERDQLLDDARQRYQKALAADPKNKAALLGLAKLYERAGDRARSAQMYHEAMKVDPKDHDVAFQLGKMLARAQDWQGAAQACQTALQHDPENRVYQKTLGYCLARSDRWDEAFGVMMKIMPEAESRYFLGRILLDLDRQSDAVQQFELALSVDRGHVASQEMLAELSAPQTPQGLPVQNPVHRAGFDQQPQYAAPIQERR